MSEKLQEAISSIKSGNKQLGQQLLAQIIQAEPNNETAWLWMSAVVDEEKRRYCIERVLKINPNNQAARQALEKINQIDIKGTTPSANPQMFPPQSMDIKQAAISNEQPLISSDVSFSETDASEKPPISITKLALTDGLKTGLLGGVAGLPLVVIAGILKNSPLMDMAIMFVIAILLSSGIVTGIIFFRRKLGATPVLSAGGALSGFISGAILSLAVGASIGFLQLLYYPDATYVVLLICGVVFPLISAVFNAITVWLPRIFIKPNKKVLSNLEKANLQIEAEAINTKKYGDFRKPSPPAQPSINEFQNLQTTGQMETKLSNPQPAVPQKTGTLSSMHSSGKIVNQELLSSETNVESQTPSSLPQFWMNPTRKGTYIFVLFAEKLFTAKCAPGHNVEVAAKLSLGEIPANLLTEKVNIPFSKLIKIEEKLDSLRIDFFDQAGRQETLKVESKDQKMTDEILSALGQKLYSEFERTTKPMSIGSILLGNGIVITIILGASAFFYYGATEIRADNISPTGSSRTRGIINLLDLLGPGGVACIGGGLLLVFLFSMISSLMKPPSVTTFSRRSISSIKKTEPIQKSELSIETQEKRTAPKEVDVKETSSPFAAALSDGVLVGLIGGLIGLPFPILFLLTKNDSFNNIGMIVDFLIFLCTGISVGILFYGRKLQRGSIAIALGGGVGGAIAGMIFGLIYILSTMSNPYISGMEGMAGNEVQVAVITAIFVAVATSVFSMSTAWIPGLFIKSDPNVKSYDWRDGKTEVQVARIESAQENYMGKLKTRFIFGGIAIGIIFFISLCQSLLNN
jgi:MFS family permease